MIQAQACYTLNDEYLISFYKLLRQGYATPEISMTSSFERDILTSILLPERFIIKITVKPA